jgi:hypothetical protein
LIFLCFKTGKDFAKKRLGLFLRIFPDACAFYGLKDISGPRFGRKPLSGEKSLMDLWFRRFAAFKTYFRPFQGVSET